MVLLNDKTYQETKDIVLGKIKKQPILNEFSLWFSRKYSSKVANFSIDKLTSPGVNRHRLQVILEDTKSYQKMCISPFEQNGVYQQEVAREFKKLAIKHKLITNESSFEDLFVAFYDFSDEAKTEANWKSTKEVQETFKNNYSFIWDVISMFSGSVVFYYSDQDIVSYKQNGINAKIIGEYYEILKKYDDLNYFTKENISLTFDSKENLDKNYEGSLFYYSR